MDLGKSLGEVVGVGISKAFFPPEEPINYDDFLFFSEQPERLG